MAANQTHSHAHGILEPRIFSTQAGIRVIQVSFGALLATSLFQFLIFLFSGSIALLSDTIHNIGDAATAIPLWFAFSFGRRRPTTRFTYGLGRLEDLAGLVIVLMIPASAVAAGYESIQRLFYPKPVENLWLVMGAAAAGFLGNEAVAVLRIRVGRKIGSAALVADGYHARADGFTSLAVLVGALGIRLGYPLADPIAGILIAATILRIGWLSGKTVLARLLDGVDPEIVDEIRRAATDADGVKEVSEVRVRWLGHRLLAEINIAVPPELSVEKGHEIANRARHELLHHLSYLTQATIHVDPIGASGEKHHKIANHFPGDERS
jgi:cation diffusion facilitator family transporter